MSKCSFLGSTWPQVTNSSSYRRLHISLFIKLLKIISNCNILFPKSSLQYSQTRNLHLNDKWSNKFESKAQKIASSSRLCATCRRLIQIIIFHQKKSRMIFSALQSVVSNLLHTKKVHFVVVVNMRRKKSRKPVSKWHLSKWESEYVLQMKMSSILKLI